MRRQKERPQIPGLADLAGLDRSYVSGVERGRRNLSLDKLEKLSLALEISIPDLLREADHRRLGDQVLESVRRVVDGTSRKEGNSFLSALALAEEKRKS